MAAAILAALLAGCAIAPTVPPAEPSRPTAGDSGTDLPANGAMPRGGEEPVDPKSPLPVEPDGQSASDLAGRKLPVEAAGLAEELVVRALGQLGVGYRWGGTDPVRGFDCSGLVHYLYREVAGIALPRRAEQMSRFGRPVEPERLTPGDLVFYNTLRRRFSHVAIYIGEGRFVHAPAHGGQVRIENLADTYWRSRFDGARRLVEVQRVEALPGAALNADTLQIDAR